MLKIKRFSNFQRFIPFLDVQDKIQILQKRFIATDLGKIYQAIPFNELVKKYKLKQNKKVPTAIFSPHGKIALEFLKCYTGYSDRKLAQYIRGSIDAQIFCDLYFDDQTIKFDYKLISKIRVEISNKLSIQETQKILASHWSPYIENKNMVLMDATCYESYLRYPTDQKLLYESVEWLNVHLKKISKKLKLKRPRTKYSDIKQSYQIYSKKKKRRISERKRITRRLLHLLPKLLGEYENLLECHHISLNKQFKERVLTVYKILDQQKQLFAGEEVKDRIVSIDKNYIRPIVRGKEKKPVEFGAKVHSIQIDGINFIEHLSFSAFNECTRLESSIKYSQKLFGEKIKFLGGDKIYPTNKNRIICTENNILTNFKQKGRSCKNKKAKKFISKYISKKRSTILEGSFGTEKEHYGDKRIKARTRETEIYQIFVKIHTKNLLKIGKRILSSLQKKSESEEA